MGADETNPRDRVADTAHTATEALEIAVEGAGLGTWEWDIVTGRTIFNARWAEILGYAVDEIAPHFDSWSKLIHPDDFPKVSAELEAHLSGAKNVYQVEHRLLHRDGRWIWILAHGRVYARNDQGAPLRAAGIHKDITERKAAEAAVVLSREAYKYTVELTTQIPWTARPDGSIIGIDPAWEVYTGLSTDSALSNDWLQAIHPDDRERMFSVWMHSVSTGEPYRVSNRLRRRDGEYRHCESRAQPQKNEAGEIIRWHGTTEDIHERTVAEQSLRASEARRALALEGAQLATWDWNIRTGEVLRDAPWFTMLGFEEDATTREAAFWNARVHPDDWNSIMQLWGAHCQDETAAFRAEYRIRHRSGEWRWILTHGRVVERDQEGPTRACGINQDITERRRFHDALAESERFSRLLLNAYQDCVALLDESGAVVYLNPAGLLQLGVEDMQSVRGRPWTSLFTEGDRTAMQDGVHSALAGNQAAFQAFGAGGESFRGWWDVLLSPLPETFNQPGKILAVAREITRLKEQEELQREAEERKRLQATLENLNEGIVIVAPDGRLVFMNRAAQAMYDIDFAGGGFIHYDELRRAVDAKDSSGRELSAAERPIARAAQGEAFSDLETYFQNRLNGREWIGACSSTPVRSASGDLLRGVLTLRDVTAGRRAADEIGRANQALQELSAQLLRLQDDERKRIARELHDGTVQSLSAAIMNLTLLSDSPQVRESDFEKKLLSKSLDLTHQSVTELRTMSYLLHPPVLDELGLIPALRSWIDGFSERTGIPVDIHMPDDSIRLASEVETTLFRITQEALGNVHRHADSTTAEVRLGITAASIQLEITDDGRGFDESVLRGGTTQHRYGVGLLGMRERARQLGGSMQVDSRPGNTSVRVDLPRRAARA